MFNNLRKRFDYLGRPIINPEDLQPLPPRYTEPENPWGEYARPIRGINPPIPRPDLLGPRPPRSTPYDKNKFKYKITPHDYLPIATGDGYILHQNPEKMVQKNIYDMKRNDGLQLDKDTKLLRELNQPMDNNVIPFSNLINKLK